MKPKLQKVCNFYLEGKSMREALILAGYSDAYASHNNTKFLHNRECQRYIRERQKQEANAALADAIFVRDKLKELANDSSKSISLAALKQLDDHLEWMKELEVKYKALEQEPNKSEAKQITINVMPAVKEKTD